METVNLTGWISLRLHADIVQGRPSTAFMQMCIKLLVAALTSEALLDNVANETLKIRTLGTLVSCLSEFLTRKMLCAPEWKLIG